MNLELFICFVAALMPMVLSQGVIASPKGKRSLRDLSHYCYKDLDKCGYDCNRDCDCKDGLVCYHRDGGKGKGKGYSDYHDSDYFYYGGLRDLNIPGCPATTPSNFYDDYCIDPHDWPSDTLWYVGSNGHPDFVYPLKECWGDCDKDEDCATGLRCFHRDGYYPTEVPGCAGHPVRGIDYCYRPPTPAPTPSPTMAPPSLEFIGNCGRRRGKGKGKGYHDNYHYDHCEPYPLELCQGDCDSSYDCAGHLVCLQRDHYTIDYPIFGCSGTPKSIDTDYCIDPDEIPADNKYLIFWGNNYKWPSSVYPFGRCQGDCDYDSDCKPGLTCVGVNHEGKIPGCEGYIQRYMNYCV